MMTPLETELNNLPEGTDIEAHFEDRYGVRVKREGDLALFKYDQLAANWQESLTRECRGAICRETSAGVWEQVSRPFAKFFNLSEGHCPLNGPDFEQMISECWAVEKVDGTCIQVWWDGVRGQWRASTLGTITPQSPGEGVSTFDVLFWAHYDQTTYVDTSYTYLFELCLPENQVVTAYPEPRVAPLGRRNIRTGETACATFGAHDVPRETREAILGAETPADVYAAVEAMQVGPEWGHVPEGIVLYHPDHGPVAKVKRSAYLALHKFASHDPARSINAMIAAFFAGQLDDIEGDLTPRAQVWCERLREGFRAFLHEEHEKIKSVCEQTPFATRKDFALALQALKSPLFALYIQRQTWIDAGAPDFLGEIEAALKGQHKGKATWERLMDLWKEMINE